MFLLVERYGNRVRRVVAWLVLLGCLVLAGLVGFWAGRVALEPPADPLAVAEVPVTFEVVEQSVGRRCSRRSLRAISDGQETDKTGQTWVSRGCRRVGNPRDA